MRKRKSLTNLFSLILVILCVTPALLLAEEMLTVEQTGPIDPPTGQIAFIRDNNIWTMNADGTDQAIVTNVGNADGRISWSMDNKKIAFTRSGFVDLRKPDNLGGRHKVYDIFLCYPDSAKAGNTQYWYRITNDMGNRDPQYISENSIIFWKDMNANLVNADYPNYQICLMEGDGGMVEILRKDWQNAGEKFLTSPSMSKNGDIAFVYFSGQTQVGLTKLHKSQMMMNIDSLGYRADKNRGMVAPAYSPDGKWIASVSNKMNAGGLYLYSADLSKMYLVAKPPAGTNIRPLAPSFSPDSRWVAFSTTDGSIWVCDITGNGLKRLTGPGKDFAPSWSH